MCGNSFYGGDKRYLVKTHYIWGRDEKGRFIHDNFKLVRELGNFTFRSTKPNRANLGDKSHIFVVDLRRFSILFLKPDISRELSYISKLLGFLSGELGLKAVNLHEIVSLFNKTGLFWSVFKNKEVSGRYEEGWSKYGSGILHLEKINPKNRSLVYSLTECTTHPIQSEKPCCDIELGAICGQITSIFDGFWTGVERKCHCVDGEFCKFELYLKTRDEEPKLSKISKNEYKTILDNLISDVVNRKQNIRKRLGDYMHVSSDQVINYMLLSLSPGHAILSKHSGVLCGERIAEKAGLEGQEAAFAYARDLFLYLKAGLLHEPETREDRLIVKMDESVYSSGVNNINMKLDVFLAGIIEGMLNQATGVKWRVEETKCLANGDDYCQFTCRKQK